METGTAVAVFIFHKNKVLLAKHKKYDMWLPPGGHVDLGERLDEAANRELLEETGLIVRYVRSPALPGLPDDIRLPLPVTLYLPRHPKNRTREIISLVAVADDISTFAPDDDFANAQWFSLAEVRDHIDMDEPIKSRVAQAWRFLEQHGVD